MNRGDALGRPSYVVVCVVSLLVSRLLPGAVWCVQAVVQGRSRAVFRLLSWAVSVRSEASDRSRTRRSGQE